MAQSYDTHLSLIVPNYLNRLNAKVTATSSKKSIEEHPYYPSLLSVSDTFDKFNIPNSAFNIEPADFKHLTPPFIAYISVSDSNNDFVLVTTVTDETISYIYNSKKAVTVTKKDFFRLFKNTVFVAEIDDKSGEDKYAEKLSADKATYRKKILWWVALAVLIALCVIINTDPAAIAGFSIITLLKFTGIAVSVMLVMLEINKDNAFIKNICKIGEKASCDAVLSSRFAKIWGISWGEIGLFYFVSSAIFLLMPNVTYNNKIVFLALFNSAACPYILFSVYYQWRIVKKWCPLCLAAQFILAAELIWSIVYYWHHPALPVINSTISSTLLICLLAPIVAWYGLKAFFLDANSYILYYNAYKRLQYNPETFKSLLMQQKAAVENWQNIGITIGNPHAVNNIIKVCNPYCGPCAKAHPKLEKIIKKNDDVKVTIIFSTSSNEFDKSTDIVKHLLAVAAEGDLTITKQALNDWYLADKKDYEIFAVKYPLKEELKNQNTKVEAMRNWCKRAEITHTPTIYVNGFQLPENYSIEDISYIV